MARVHPCNRRNSRIHGEHETKGLCLRQVKQEQISAFSSVGLGLVSQR
jgi:hypothetical protein